MSGPNFKKTPWRSETYRRFVASLPCCLCYAYGCNAHHEQLNGGKMGGKESDEFCIPLCVVHHHYRHHYGKGIWRQHGKNPKQLITATQQAWFDKYKTRPWERG